MNSLQVVLYGINSVTNTLLQSHPDAIFATTQGGGTYHNKPILSLEELSAQYNTPGIQIIICSMFVDDIANALVEHGFSLSAIYFYNITHCKVLSCEDTIRKSGGTEQTLHVVYDMKVNLPCYDALSFAAVAEAERIKRKLKYIHFYMLSANPGGNKLSFDANYTEDDRSWRIANIVKPIFESLPSYIGCSDIINRADLTPTMAGKLNLFPEDILTTQAGVAHGLLKLEEYYNNGIPMPELKVQPAAASMVQTLLDHCHAQNKKLVTLTLRNTPTHPERNTPVGPWIEFLQSLDTDTYFPVLLRDTSECLNATPLSQLAFEVPAATISFALRIALYDAAYINLSSSGGPSFAYYFLKGCSSIRYSPIDDNHFATARNTLETAGFKIGEEQFFAQNGLHQIPFEVETFESIQQAFNHQCQMLECNTYEV
ncbi:hypothetical protein [Pseudoalteromonas sp. McH1-42]|uniref:hypothetical protein n=1 Tax=Pseudoalteromonas sp. McH1-42 TaxID=2917752 RepID=UPI001EF72352|nr:hypothetical protein [Pseudoalteromonas sp. McH1-42]MCG7563598.1 hypothetical protein [Pseudoalteromonas sp. McH1-42]